MIINFHNAERFLGEAIESVLAQTHRPIELILVDDGSTDGSAAIAREYEWRHAFISYHQHAGGRNRGMSASRNLGLRLARGKYVGFLDADDVWLPHKLETELALFRRYPGADMVCCSTLIWFSWTRDAAELGRLGRRPKISVDRPVDEVRAVGRGKWEGMVRPGRLLQLHLGGGNCLPQTIGVLVRRRAALEAGGFEESFPRMYDDQAFFSKLALQARICVTSECLAKYRQHGDSICQRARLAWSPDGGSDGSGPRRADYLRWLEAYASRQGRRGRRVVRAIRAARAAADACQAPGSGAD